jgi:photosystem II stability/assembly factor-like uncharacterized protein
VNSIGVDFSDPNRQTLIAGGHEQSQVVYKSIDGGATWTQIGGNLPNGSGFSQDPVVINATTYIINTYPSYGGGTPGIYRTTNGGTSWTRVTLEQGNQPALVMPDGDIYYSDGNGVVRSTDQGQSWVAVGTNLRSEFRPSGLPDGRLLSVDNNNRLVVSSDKGSTWSEFGPPLPFSNGFSGGISYSAVNQAVYVWHWDCNFSNPIVLPDSVYQLK